MYHELEYVCRFFAWISRIFLGSAYWGYRMLEVFGICEFPKVTWMSSTFILGKCYLQHYIINQHTTHSTCFYPPKMSKYACDISWLPRFFFSRLCHFNSLMFHTRMKSHTHANLPDFGTVRHFVRLMQFLKRHIQKHHTHYSSIHKKKEITIVVYSFLRVPQ